MNMVVVIKGKLESVGGSGRELRRPGGAGGHSLTHLSVKCRDSFGKLCWLHCMC